MVQLRSFVFLDSFQPQLASFTASTSRGYLPVAGEASLWVEIAPGIAINQITDIAQKQTQVRPGVQVVERAFGLLEIHDANQAEVVEAGERILGALELTEQDRLAPRVLTSEIITDLDPYQSMLINRNRGGNMVLEGQAFYILEVEPAGYIVLAANEAEKASPISLIDVRPIGAFGRLYFAGTESVVQQGAQAAVKAIESVKGVKRE